MRLIKFKTLKFTNSNFLEIKIIRTSLNIFRQNSPFGHCFKAYLCIKIDLNTVKSEHLICWPIYKLRYSVNFILCSIFKWWKKNNWKSHWNCLNHQCFVNKFLWRELERTQNQSYYNPIANIDKTTTNISNK